MNTFRSGKAEIFLLLVFLFFPVKAAVNVLTYHVNNERTGANLQETILTPDNVNSASFGKLFSYAVDGYVFAQPLYVSGLTVSGNTKNVLFVATEHNTVFAFDADSNTGPNGGLLWQINLGPSAATPTTDFGWRNGAFADISPEVGITGTPVIDLASGTLYVDTFTHEGTNYFHRLHALNITNGTERAFSPVLVSASLPGTGVGGNGSTVTFNPRQQLQRTALTLAGGVLYVAYAGYADTDPYHGWIMGYDPQTLAQLPNYIFSTTPNATVATFGPNAGEGGIWMAGCGLSVDANTNLYFGVGNGSFNALNGAGGTEYGDSYLKLSTANGLSVSDYFTPYNQQFLADNDIDIGSGGVLLLPDQPGPNPHLMVSAGKQGRVYLMNRDQLTAGNNHYNNGGTSDAIVQSFSLAQGVFSTPAWFNGRIYYGASGDKLSSFPIVNGMFTGQYQISSRIFQYPGATPTVSANGTANGIVWALKNGTPAMLVAYDASNLTNEIYNSSQVVNRDGLTNGVKFTTPVVANGKVYTGSRYSVAVFGLLAGSPPPPPPNTTNTIWVEDTLPAGAVASADGGDAWTWVSSSPTPFSGARASQSNIGAGSHQHFFFDATNTLSVGTGDTLFAYVYLDPANVPSEIMLQWWDGSSWEHRAFWGADNIAYGATGTTSRRYMGPLPAAGQWVKLSVPASQVALEGRTLTGMAFSLYGGRATWDYAGKESLSVSNPLPDTTPPTVLMLAPPHNSTVSGNAVTVSASASDNVAISNVQFRLDAQNLNAPDFVSPYSINWDSTASTNGTHQLAAVATDTSGNQTASASVSVTVSNSPLVATNAVWVDDSLPAGAVASADGGDNWTWVSSNPTPFFGTLAHQSGIAAGSHQHFFFDATNTLSVGTGDTLFAYVYLDPVNVPSEIMLQWWDGSSWEHRAFWGGDSISYGASGTTSRRSMGSLPAAGQWVKLSVPANQVALEGRTLTGMAFSLYGGRATWDYAGKQSSGTPPPADTTPPTVSLTAPAGNTTVSGNAVIVSANASDNVAISSVQFRLDNQNLGAPDTVAPYSLAWNTTASTNGPHQLSAIATDTSGNQTASVAVSVTVSNAASTGTNIVWVEDALPAGAVANGDGIDTWNWITSNPAPFSGTRAHQSGLAAGQHQHSFAWASSGLFVATGGTLFAYVYLDAANPPSEVMLQWWDGTWEHRAYWGANNVAYGTAGTASRRYMGTLPAAGQWVRLSIPANQVALEGRTLTGMAFTLYGGRATWDYAGVANP